MADEFNKSAQPCTVYIDEAGDLGFNRGTQWFVLSGVVVNNSDEKTNRQVMQNIKSNLNINAIHFRKLRNFEQKCYVVQEISTCKFEYANIIIDTSKLNIKVKNSNDSSSLITYNFACRLLLERISWLLRDTNRIGKIVLSSRGTSRDNELIQYIKNKLLPCHNNIINLFTEISSKQASEWDMLQLADICATTMFYSHEPNNYGFISPCYTFRLAQHLYKYKGDVKRYGAKYYCEEMKPSKEYFEQRMICK